MFYLFGIIYLIYEIWLILYKPAKREKEIDENDSYAQIQWVKENPRIWIPTLTKWIWLPMGLFTHLWFLFLLLILLEFLYDKIYYFSVATKHHKLFWHIHHIAEIMALISIFIIHFIVSNNT